MVLTVAFLVAFAISLRQCEAHIESACCNIAMEVCGYEGKLFRDGGNFLLYAGNETFECGANLTILDANTPGTLEIFIIH